MHHEACGILVPQSGIEPSHCSESTKLSPNHWTTREFPLVATLDPLAFSLLIFLSAIHLPVSPYYRS